jgi:hypothetical protein
VYGLTVRAEQRRVGWGVSGAVCFRRTILGTSYLIAGVVVGHKCFAAFGGGGEDSSCDARKCSLCSRVFSHPPRDLYVGTVPVMFAPQFQDIVSMERPPPRLKLLP